MLALSGDEVRALVPMTTAIELMKVVFAELSSGKAVSPLRTPIDVPDEAAVALFMPAYVPSQQGLGLKIVSVFPHNRALGKPTIHALVAVISAETGEPLAVLDGTYLTALRTGAVSGAATDLLARADSRVVTCIGAGAQGVTQAWAVASVRPIERIYVADMNPESVRAFATRLGALAPELADKVHGVSNLDDALAESDIVCTATTSKTPVFRDAALKAGTHINAIGAFTPEMQEIPVETVKRARIIVDAVDAVLAESGDLIIPIARGEIDRSKVSLELGQVASGAPGRIDDDEITLFESVGNAVQDIIVARYAVGEAERLGLGQRFSL
ncbi:MAG TPA: ornithine cyclodeaminase [Nitrolancea sp.]|nr:ornithine cyclodeaminase [Nitrolancea sp.]